MRVVVIGAGVVGCATAYEMSRAGHEVILVDAEEPGRGASFANGAQLSYSYVEPLASPATLRALPRLLLSPESPLRFRPRLEPAQWAWGWRFLRSCTRTQAARGTLGLLELGDLSRRTLEAWMRDDRLEFGFRRNGKFVLSPDARTLEQQRRQVALQARHGASQEVLTREECIAREPALARYAGFAGGVWTASECAADPFMFCKALTAALPRRGGTVHAGVRARGFALSGGKASALLTSHGELPADVFVIAAGLASRELARPLGERLAIYPVKGYSLTLKIADPSRIPVASVTDLASKTVFARVGDRLRVAAMADIVGPGLDIPPDRIDAIKRTVTAVLPGACAFDAPRPWAGLRPLTPDSMPIVRPSRVPNVLLNAGHGALGFTLAAGSARRLSSLLARTAAERAH